MQPLDSRAYFVNMNQATRHVWIKEIDAFHKAARAAEASLIKLLRKEIDLQYDQNAHAFVELPKSANPSDPAAMRSKWLQDHLQLLVNKVGNASQEILKFLEAKAATKASDCLFIPPSLRRFLDKVYDNTLKTLEKKAQDQLNRKVQAVNEAKKYLDAVSNEYRKAVRRREGQDLYVQGLDLHQVARNAAQLSHVPPDLQAVHGQFVKGLQDIARQGRAAQDQEHSSLQQLLEDPLCHPKQLIRLLAAIAPQAPSDLRKFFGVYAKVIYAIDDYENFRIRALKEMNMAEIEVAKLKREIPPAVVAFHENALEELVDALKVASEGRSPRIIDPAQIQALNVQIKALKDGPIKAFEKKLERLAREGLDALNKLDLATACQECQKACSALGVDGMHFTKWIGLIKDKAFENDPEDLFRTLFSTGPQQFLARFPAFLDQLSKQPDFVSYGNLKKCLFQWGAMMAAMHNLVIEEYAVQLQVQALQNQQNILCNKGPMRPLSDDGHKKVEIVAIAFLKASGEPNPAAFIAAKPKPVAPQPNQMPVNPPILVNPAATPQQFPGQVLPKQLPAQRAVPQAPAGAKNAAGVNQGPGAPVQKAPAPAKADAPVQKVSKSAAKASSRERRGIVGLFKRAAAWLRSIFTRFFSWFKR